MKIFYYILIFFFIHVNNKQILSTPRYLIVGKYPFILPDSNNFCLAPKVSLWTLLKDNHKFVDGSFKGTELASLHTVEKVRLSYDKSILMQCDGETTMLTPAHFPLIIELTDPCLRVLKPVAL